VAKVRRKVGASKMRAKARIGLRRGLVLSGKLVSQRATRRAPRLTGRLKRSIKEGKPYNVGRRGMAIDIGTNVEYAAAQEFGSGLHATRGPKKRIKITPKNKQALAFFWPDAPAHIKPSETTGKVVLAKVMHPGVRAQPYLRPALKDSRGDIKKLIGGQIALALRSP
jgi:hypothetical protein